MEGITMTTATEMKNDQLMAVYLQLRDRRAQRKKAFDEADASDKAYQEKIEAMFLSRFNDTGSDTISCRGIGTAYKTLRTTASVADWDAVLEFVKEKDLWQLLTQAVSKAAVEEYLATNAELPPGVNVRRETTVNIRRN
jgi:hypothetical protein